MNKDLLLQLITLVCNQESSSSNINKNNTLYSDCLDKFCVIRSYGAGVFFGKVKIVEDNFAVKLENARRIHYWDNHTAASCSDLALYGINEENTHSAKSSRVCAPIDVHYIQQVLEIIPCTPLSIKCFNEFRVWTENE